MRRLTHRAPMAIASAMLLGVFATSCSTEDPTSGTGTDDTSESAGTEEDPAAEESPTEEVELSLIHI